MCVYLSLSLTIWNIPFWAGFEETQDFQKTKPTHLGFIGFLGFFFFFLFFWRSLGKQQGDL